MFIVQEADYLAHVGIMGMKWHHHKIGNTIQTKTANIEKWGTDKDHNILYITGYSGSGKSTLAVTLKDKNTNVIHLDPYFEKMDKNVSASIKDKEFTKFLDKNFPEYQTIANHKDGERHTKPWWNKVDKLMKQTEKFAEQQYPKKKVIVEGVQLSDNTAYGNNSFYKGKPLAITETGAIKSYLRASKRDDKSIIKSIKGAKEYIQWYGNMTESISKLSEVTNTKKGNDWVDKYLASKGGMQINETK